MAKLKPKIERRLCSQEFRVVSDDNGSHINGYAAVFDSPSYDIGWNEEIDPHAFDGVLASNPDVCALFNHDDNLVLGRTTSGTLRLSADARGLAYSVDPPDTQFARDLMISIGRRDISGSSFGFITARDQWTENPDGSVTRRILEVAELFDVSPVTFPAYGATSSSVRSIPLSCPAEFRSRIVRKEQRDDDDDDDASANSNGCKCQCPECVSDDCDNCSDPDCTDPACLANQRSSSAHNHAAHRSAGCGCKCEQCRSGNCGICSDLDCNDAQCKSCQQQRKRPISAEERSRMEMRLAFARLK